jgi:hypothetical protein
MITYWIENDLTVLAELIVIELLLFRFSDISTKPSPSTDKPFRPIAVTVV